MTFPMIESAGQLMERVDEIGFLPMFRSSIAGFSLEELTPPGRWFAEGVEGPWEWREVLAASDDFAYGKLFERKAGFISKAWLPRFINFRRDGYDFDARYEDSLAPERAKRIIDLLMQRGPTLSGEIKRGAGFGKDGLKGFDAMMALLQMQTYITVKSFDYKYDAMGQRYGFGTGRYALVEQVFGDDFVQAAYEETPAQSRLAILTRLMDLFPEIQGDKAEKFII